MKVTKAQLETALRKLTSAVEREYRLGAPIKSLNVRESLEEAHRLIGKAT